MNYIPRVGHHGGPEGEQIQRGAGTGVTCAEDQTQGPRGNHWPEQFPWASVTKGFMLQLSLRVNPSVLDV